MAVIVLSHELTWSLSACLTGPHRQGLPSQCARGPARQPSCCPALVHRYCVFACIFGLPTRRHQQARATSSPRPQLGEGVRAQGRAQDYSHVSTCGSPWITRKLTAVLMTRAVNAQPSELSFCRIHSISCSLPALLATTSSTTAFSAWSGKSPIVLRPDYYR